MAFTDVNSYVGAAKQDLHHYKTITRTVVANIYYSLFDSAGAPAGTLAGTNTANGLVPTDATAGYVPINTFGGGNKGYLTRAVLNNTNVGNISVFDRLFLAGAYAFNANTTLATQPSYAGRVPGGTDFKGLRIFVEAVTAFTGNPTITITYTNQDGTTGRTTGAIATGAALGIGRCVEMPLQAGDTGVQKIESVVCTVATVGTFNVMVLRPLINLARIKFVGDTVIYNFTETGLVEVFNTSAIYYLVRMDSTSSGLPSVSLEISNG